MLVLRLAIQWDIGVDLHYGECFAVSSSLPMGNTSK